MCWNDRCITLFSLPGKVHSGVLKRRLWPVCPASDSGGAVWVFPWPWNSGTVEQLIILLCSLTAPWEFAHTVCMCFVDPERAHNNPVFGFHEQDLEVQPRTVMSLTITPLLFANDVVFVGLQHNNAVERLG